MTGPVDRLTALYGPNVHDLVRQLPDLGDGLHAQLVALHDLPCESACEALARNLHGAAAHVLRLADRIRAEVGE